MLKPRIMASLFGAMTLASATAPTLAEQPAALPPVMAHIPSADANGVWLGHGYVAVPATVALVPQTATFMAQHKIGYWFVNVGRVDKNGKLPPEGLSQAVNFLDALARWETANKRTFKVLAWINGSIDAANQERFVDISKPELRADIADEATKLVDVQAPQSYIAGAKRSFDGVQLDLEPSGGDGDVTTNLLNLMDEIHQEIGSDKLTSFTPHKIGTRNVYWSTPDFYYQLGQHIDLICAMTYDTGLSDAARYRQWMQSQTTEILRAVSGATWNNDAGHPRPKSTVRTFIGLAAFPPNKWHDVQVETISDGAWGIRLGLDELTRTKPSTLPYFGGAAVYLYTDGTGADDYSNAQNWADFQSVWLRK